MFQKAYAKTHNNVLLKHACDGRNRNFENCVPEIYEILRKIEIRGHSQTKSGKMLDFSCPLCPLLSEFGDRLDTLQHGLKIYAIYILLPL